MAVIDTQSDLTLTAAGPNPTKSASTQIVGQQGSHTYWYWVVVHYPIGSAVSGPFLARLAPDILSASNYVLLSWQPAVKALNYDVLRTSSQQFPQTAGNYALAEGTTATQYLDQGSTPLPYDPAGLPFGAPASCIIHLNNRDYAKPTLEMPCQIRVSTIVFPDGSEQSTAGGGGGGQSPWTEDQDAAGHNLINSGCIIFAPATCNDSICVDVSCNIVYSTGGQAMAWMTPAGRLGIGTATPSAQVDIVASTDPALSLTGPSTFNNRTNLFFKGRQSGGLLWIVGTDPDGSGSQNFAILEPGFAPSIFCQASTGFVGINSEDPGTNLEVDGVSANPSVTANSGIITVEGSQGGHLQIGSLLTPPNTGTYFLQCSMAGAGSPLLLNPVGGNVGIGTSTPSSRLSVVGLPTTATGLTTGGIWVDTANGNVLKIV